MCLVYNLIAGAPTDREAAIRYVVCAVCFSIIISGLSGHSIYRILSINVADDVEEQEYSVDKSYQGSLIEVVSSFRNKRELTKEEIKELKNYLEDLEE